MPKHLTTRIAWYVLGACLLVAVVVSIVLRVVPAPDKPWFRMLRDLDVLLDVFAFLLWMLVLALVASRRHHD